MKSSDINLNILEFEGNITKTVDKGSVEKWKWTHPYSIIGNMRNVR